MKKKSLKIGDVVIVYNKSLCVTTKVVEINKKAKEAKLDTGMKVSLYYYKNKDLSVYNSKIHYENILVMGSKAKKILRITELEVSFNLLKHYISSTDLKKHMYDKSKKEDLKKLQNNLNNIIEQLKSLQ